jgi:hypothetical protein
VVPQSNEAPAHAGLVAEPGRVVVGERVPGDLDPAQLEAAVLQQLRGPVRLVGVDVEVDSDRVQEPRGGPGVEVGAPGLDPERTAAERHPGQVTGVDRVGDHSTRRRRRGSDREKTIPIPHRTADRGRHRPFRHQLKPDRSRRRAGIGASEGESFAGTALPDTLAGGFQADSSIGREQDVGGLTGEVLRPCGSRPGRFGDGRFRFRFRRGRFRFGFRGGRFGFRRRGLGRFGTRELRTWTLRRGWLRAGSFGRLKYSGSGGDRDDRATAHGRLAAATRRRRGLHALRRRLPPPGQTPPPWPLHLPHHHANAHRGVACGPDAAIGDHTLSRSDLLLGAGPAMLRGRGLSNHERQCADGKDEVGSQPQRPAQVDRHHGHGFFGG